MGKADGGLRKLIHGKMPGFWQAIETGLTGKGVPDSFYCIDGICGWVEFKATETTRVGLMPEQVAWIHRFTRAGGRAFILVRYKHNGGPRKGPPVDELWLYPGSQVVELKQQGLELKPLWSGSVDQYGHITSLLVS